MGSSVNKTAAILIIGNEVLSGRTKDANVNAIATKLNEIGVTLSEGRVVRDIESEIIHAVNELRQKYDYVFTTGGIGTTHDDITAASVAKAFGVDVRENAEALRLLIANYHGKLTQSARKMAMIPTGAKLIANPVTIAPGFYLENVFVMAGVPIIAAAMFDDVIGKITHGSPIVSKSLTCHLPESFVSERFADLQSAYPSLDLGSYPRWGSAGFNLNLVIRGVDEDLIIRAFNDLEALIVELTNAFDKMKANDR